MPVIKYVEHNGTEHAVEVANGLSVMAGAKTHAIPGIDADCGGSCTCATCHVYIDDDRLSQSANMSIVEETLLQFIRSARPASRLSCQIVVGPHLDGLIVRLPERQG